MPQFTHTTLAFAAGAAHSRALTQASESGVPILIIAEGAPPVVIEGLSIRGQLRTTAGQLMLRNCAFDGQHIGFPTAVAGAALHVLGGSVEVHGTRFTSLVAQETGGAIAIFGGVLMLFDCGFLASRRTAAA